MKVGRQGSGDGLSRFGTASGCGDSLPWLSEARNKKSVTVDLRKPEGAEILKDLVRRADMLVENFQPGTLEGWGLDGVVLEAVNQGLVMVRISGSGKTGPYSDRKSTRRKPST